MSIPQGLAMKNDVRPAPVYVTTYKDASVGEFTARKRAVRGYGFRDKNIARAYNYLDISAADIFQTPEEHSDMKPAVTRSVEPIRVFKSEPLLLAATILSQEQGPTCANALLWNSLWVKDPELDIQPHDMGFLSQLAQLCLRSGVRECTNGPCINIRADMVDIAMPRCDWKSFVDWAAVAMSCQAAMREHYEQHIRQHTHIARAVHGCCMILKECNSDLEHQKNLFRPCLDGDPDNKVNLNSVIDVIYWMAKIQYANSIGPEAFGRWGAQLLPDDIYRPSLKSSADTIEALAQKGFCRTRLWNLVQVSDRKEADLQEIFRSLLRPDVIPILRHDPESRNDSPTQLPKHSDCVAENCQMAHVNTTRMPQLHVCSEQSCPGVTFTEQHWEQVDTAVKQGNSTAWCCEPCGQHWKPSHTIQSDQRFMAISHVWSNGTGQGLEVGVVNSCLLDLWMSIAKDNGCDGIWWDAISVPKDVELRSLALETMHENYSTAEFTLVFDSYLRNIPKDSPWLACVGLVLSDWFTRGWAALELATSKHIKVLVGSEQNDQQWRWDDSVQPKKPGFHLKDLEGEHGILATKPESTSRAHWLATQWLSRLREDIDDVGDLVSILSNRQTTFAADRPVIAANLAKVPDFDSKAGNLAILRRTLSYLRRIPQTCLLHGRPTMQNQGPFSWCPATMEDMPIPAPADMESPAASDVFIMLDIDDEGAVMGEWYCRHLQAMQDMEKDVIVPYGDDISTQVKVESALANPEDCLLLRPAASSNEDPALLVIPLHFNPQQTILDCRYVGAVLEERKGKDPVDEVNDEWHWFNIRLGSTSETHMNAFKAISTIHSVTPLNRGGCKCIKQTEEEFRVEWQDFHTSFRGGGSDWWSKAISQEQVPNTVANNPNANSGLKAARTEELTKAVLDRNQDAMEYLISLDICTLKEADLHDIFQQSSVVKQRESIYGLWMLGDACCEMNQRDQALAAYDNASRACDEFNFPKVPNCVRTQIKSNSAHVFALDPSARRSAIESFSQVLRDCKEFRNSAVRFQGPSYTCSRRTRAHCHKYDIHQRLQVRKAPMEESREKGYRHAVSGKQKDENTVEGWSEDPAAWELLEYDARTELLLLEIAPTWELAKATMTIWQLLDPPINNQYKHQGLHSRSEVLAQIESGNIHFESWSQLLEEPGHPIFFNLNELKTRAEIYETQHRYFNTKFRQDHSLVYLIELHIGVNSALQAKFHTNSDVEDHDAQTEQKQIEKEQVTRERVWHRTSDFHMKKAMKSIERALNGLDSRLRAYDTQGYSGHHAVALAQFFAAIIKIRLGYLDGAERYLNDCSDNFVTSPLLKAAEKRVRVILADKRNNQVPPSQVPPEPEDNTGDNTGDNTHEDMCNATELPASAEIVEPQQSSYTDPEEPIPESIAYDQTSGGDVEDPDAEYGEFDGPADSQTTPEAEAANTKKSRRWNRLRGRSSSSGVPRTIIGSRSQFIQKTKALVPIATEHFRSLMPTSQPEATEENREEALEEVRARESIGIFNWLAGEE